MKVRVAIVDDHAAVRQMLALLLEREGNYEICGEAGTGFEALKMVRKAKPRVLILDVLLPELNGVEVLRALRVEKCDSRILLFSGTMNRDLIVEALQARPHGFVHKQEPLPIFREALRAVGNGSGYFTPFASDLLNEARGGRAGWDALSSRERAILQMIAEGRANKEIALLLCISPKTVEHHRSHLMEKLGLHDVASLTRCAVRRGLVALA
jgi:DNA-binding NarL/FixJ family response regulator